jgi:hypothetical protein
MIARALIRVNMVVIVGILDTYTALGIQGGSGTAGSRPIEGLSWAGQQQGVEEEVMAGLGGVTGG